MNNSDIITIQNKTMYESATELLEYNNLDYIEDICLKIDLGNLNVAIPPYYFDLWGERLFLNKSLYNILLLVNPEYDDMFELLNYKHGEEKKIRYIIQGNLKMETLEEAISKSKEMVSTPNLISKNS